MPTTSNFGWTTPADTDLVKDGAAAIRTLGDGIDTSLLDLKGGTTGQILSKNSNTDLDYTWVTPNVGDLTEVQAGTGISVADGTGPIPVVTNTVATTFDAKGDLVVGTGADTFAKLTVGTNGYTLVADSNETTGLKWAAPAAGGKVLQVVAATYNTAVTNSTTTYEDTGLTATITPSSASSKVLVLIHQAGCHKSNAANGSAVAVRAFRGATDIGTISVDGGYTNSTLQLDFGTVSASILDTPATTSATTYKTQFKCGTASATATVQFSTARSSIVLMEIGA